MAKTHTKEAAEALLRELPSVVGAFVREDINGHPREVHILIGPGPNPRHLARDIRDLLQEKLSVNVDQRVISIAQLTISADDLAADLGEIGVYGGGPSQPAGEPRLRFEALETQTREGMIIVRVRLQIGDRLVTGEGCEVDVALARLRAAAGAALSAAAQACDQTMRFQLDSAAPVRAFGRDYVVVTVLASSTLLGRKPLPLVAAQPADDDADHAAALAALMAVNRVIGVALRPTAR